MTQLQITRSAVRRPQGRRRKSCPFSGPNAPKIDYKDVKLLTRFTSERGKIVPSRISAVSAKKQRIINRYKACAVFGTYALRDQLSSGKDVLLCKLYCLNALKS